MNKNEYKETNLTFSVLIHFMHPQNKKTIDSMVIGMKIGIGMPS